MPSKSRKEVEAWLVAGNEPSGVLAWDRSPPVDARPSKAAVAAAHVLVTRSLPVASVQRHSRVASALARLEQVEARKDAEAKANRRRHG